MFGNFKDLAQLPQMLAKAKEMQAKMGEMQEKLKAQLENIRTTADAGDGSVEATCNGKLELISIKIDSAAVDHTEHLEAHVVKAVTEAQQKAASEAAQLTQRLMTEAAQEAGLPPEMLGGMGGLG